MNNGVIIKKRIISRAVGVVNDKRNGAKKMGNKDFSCLDDDGFDFTEAFPDDDLGLYNDISDDSCGASQVDTGDGEANSAEEFELLRGISDDAGGFDYGPGVDCEHDDGVTNADYGDSLGSTYGGTVQGSVANISNGNDYDGQGDAAREDYNFGYGGNRHNRESGERFHGLGRWRRRD
ncbi:MAG: hypothetical protein K6C05_05295 [Anaerovibrio sp.]|uniref:hypothetical protein n=1 Tax=Anaerovibrio sp. TaxID=1872532 RepID=UPI0025FCD06A|nr:hypothetical protein [Anaerovibrio sp.]MCR5176247.1 hypothetical protein [Anaerovibrio sp.]